MEVMAREKRKAGEKHKHLLLARIMVGRAVWLNIGRSRTFNGALMALRICETVDTGTTELICFSLQRDSMLASRSEFIR